MLYFRYECVHLMVCEFGIFFEKFPSWSGIGAYVGKRWAKIFAFLIIKDHLRQKIEFRHQQKTKNFFF